MKKTKRLWALLLAMVMALGLISTAFAAPTIDSGRKASLSLYKYDITAASADGAWDAASYVSTGVQDDAVTDKLAQYAIQGVEFTYLRVADIAMNNELVNGQRQVTQSSGLDHHAVYSRQRVDDFRENAVVSTQSARQCKDAVDLICQKADVHAHLIRRLTPLECERLQGFPDGWTDIPGASDSARYKALGNSVAIPCVDFVMQCLVQAVQMSENIR